MVTGIGQGNLEKVGLIAAVEGIDRYLQNIREIARGQDLVQKEMEDTEGVSRRTSRSLIQDWNKVGRNMALVGGAITAAFGFGVKAAIDFESAMGDVRKTVDEGEPGFLRLQEGITQLSRELPVAREEIARTVAAAGQLGVEGVDNLLAFTEVALGLGISTDLSAQDASFALAQLFNVTGDAGDRIDEIGAVIVDLGNNTATTESRILDFAQRIAAGGTNAGLTTEEILGLSATVLSLGVNTERGATQISTAFAQISLAIGEGGDKLTEFARLSGLSAEEFRTAWREDAAGTFQLLIQGLASAGDEATLFLNKIGLDGTRAVEVFQALARSEGQLTGNIELANRAAQENVALAEEVARRNATTAARIQRAWNEIKIAFAEAGDTLLPILETVIDAVQLFLDVWEEVPAPIRIFIVVFTALLGLMVGGIGTLLVLNNQMGLFTREQLAAAASARVLGVSLTTMIPIVGGLIAVVTALTFAFLNMGQASDEAAGKAAAAGRIREIADDYDELGEKITISIERTGEYLRVLDSQEKRQDAVNRGVLENIQLTTDQFRAVGDLVDKGVEFATALEIIVSATERQSENTEQAAEAQATYTRALDDAAGQQMFTAEQLDRLTQGYLENADGAEAAADGAETAADANVAMGRSARRAGDDLGSLGARAIATAIALAEYRIQAAEAVGINADLGFAAGVVGVRIGEQTAALERMGEEFRFVNPRVEEILKQFGFIQDAAGGAAGGVDELNGAFRRTVEAIELVRAQAALDILIDSLQRTGGDQEALALALLLSREAKTGGQITSGIRKIAELFPNVGTAIGPAATVGQGGDLEQGLLLLIDLLGGRAGASLPSFQTGGFVTGGAQGAPVLAQLHVGEFVIPADRVAALLGPRASETSTRGDVHFTANYFELESPVRVRDDLETLRLAGVF